MARITTITAEKLGVYQKYWVEISIAVEKYCSAEKVVQRFIYDLEDQTVNYPTVIAVAELEHGKAVYVPENLEDRHIQSLFEKICLYAKHGEQYFIFSPKGLSDKLIEWLGARGLNVKLYILLG